jgi:hypothetical protein
MDIGYGANDPMLLSSSSSSFPSRPPSKPLYPKQLCHINLHDMSAHDFLQAFVHEVETDVVPDDATTYNPPVDEFNAVKGIVLPAFLLTILVKTCQSIPSVHLIWLMLRVRYPIIQPHLDNPCPSLTEVSMILVMVLTCGHSSKLDVLETLEVLIPTNVSKLVQLEESFRPIRLNYSHNSKLHHAH